MTGRPDDLAAPAAEEPAGQVPPAPASTDLSENPPFATPSQAPDSAVWEGANASSPSPPQRRRARPALLAGAALLALGVGGGAGISALVARGGSTPSGTTVLSVDTATLPPGAQGTAVSVAAQLSPAVGTIITGGGGGTGLGSGGLGSGFVISNKGSVSYLLTNNHVVASGSDLHVVMPDGRTFSATVVGTDSFDDLAVVSVPDGHLAMAAFGRSSQLKVGQAVVAIGSPLGNQGTVTAGVISALHRTIQAGGNAGSSQETLQDVLQTDTAINPGNSGGPLADTAGRVVGVNVAVSGQASNIGFSIPSDVAQRVAEQLINHQTLTHPFVGIGYMDPIQAAENGRPFNGPGVVVTSIQSGSPAAQAGIQQGDIVVSIDGVTLDNGQTIGGVIQAHKVGDRISLSLKRGSQTMNVSLTLAERPANVG